jgi:hypothetical protein
MALRALSAAGPLQAFAGPPMSAIMTRMPWLVVPGFLVPGRMFIRVVISIGERAPKPQSRPIHGSTRRRRDEVDVKRAMRLARKLAAGDYP